MRKKRWITYVVMILMALYPSYAVVAQYVDSSGDNSMLREYFEEDEDNWNRSIIYVFYNNEPCESCADAMGMIYNLYEQQYSNLYSYFEINYQEPGEEEFAINYQLMQPLSVVLVRINDGMAKGYKRIDNPQYWVSDPSYLVMYLSNEINNFFN